MLFSTATNPSTDLEAKKTLENKSTIDAGFKMDAQEVPLLQFEKIETAVTKLKAAFTLEANERKILTAATVAKVGQHTKQYLIEKGLDKESNQSIDIIYLRRIMAVVTEDQFSNLISASRHIFSTDYISPALKYLTTTINQEQSQNRSNSQSNLNASVTTAGLFSSTEQKNEKTEQTTQAPLIDDENDDTPEVSTPFLRQRKGFSLTS